MTPPATSGRLQVELVVIAGALASMEPSRLLSKTADNQMECPWFTHSLASFSYVMYLVVGGAGEVVGREARIAKSVNTQLLFRSIGFRKSRCHGPKQLLLRTCHNMTDLSGGCKDSETLSFSFFSQRLAVILRHQNCCRSTKR